MELTKKEREDIIVRDSYELPNNVINKVPKPMVSVLTTTFQHVNFIKDCIEGVLSQKTTFPIEYLIGEDFSTDGTREIVFEYAKKYPDIIRVITADYNMHKYKGNSRRLKLNARGKYIAICEGDDCWTDLYKLQKQVDFLETHPDYGLIHTELDHYYVKIGKLVKNHWETSNVREQEGDLYVNFMKGKNSMIYYCTACYRNDLINNNADFDKVLQQNFLIGDTTMSLYISSKSKIGYINESMAVRNVLLYSMTQGRSFKYNLKLKLDGIRKVKWFHDNIRKLAENDLQDALLIAYKRILHLCFINYKGKDIFEKYYKKIDTEKRTLELKIMNCGMKNSLFHFIARVLLKIRKEINRKLLIK
jgi:glycosyltransferase involved in cell wall biosynthesis